jgi:hypothetical protein
LPVADEPPRCPLCRSGGALDYCSDGHRDFLQCPACSLVFVDPHQRLDAQAERAEYDKHQNAPTDAGYRRFLGRLFEPLRERLPPAQQGLDFGCGPGPTLSVMLREAGHECAEYDPFYAPDHQVFTRDFDFITATEVVEHLHFPGEELNRLWGLLRPGGMMGLMTKRVIDREAFGAWHYKNDPTHVCFFSRETFEWVANHLGAHLEILGQDVVFLSKAGAPSPRLDGIV